MNRLLHRGVAGGGTWGQTILDAGLEGASVHFAVI